MKRFFQITLILVLALGGLFLAMRQIALDNIKLSTSQTMKIAADGFERKVVEWQSDLQYLARQSEVISTVVAKRRNRSSVQNLESLFREFLKLRKDYVTSIRLVDRFGRERVVVDTTGPSRNYMNVSRKGFFQRAMAQRAFGAIATLGDRNNQPVLEYSIPLVNGGFTTGVVSMGIDIAMLTRYFSEFSETLPFNHIYLLSDGGQVVHQDAIKVRPEPTDLATVKEVFVAFENSAANLRVLDTNGEIWSYLDNDTLGFSFLMEMDSQHVWVEVTELYTPVAALFSAAIFLVLITRSRRKRLVRKGALLVTENGSNKSRSKNSDEPGVRLKDLANISNEIRTPLNNVLGMLSLLRVSSLNSKQKEHLDLATRYSEWILELINEITDFSALKKGKLKLDRVEFNIRQTMRDVTEILSVEAYKKGLEVFSLVNADVPERIVGDPTRLRQILVNLIGNGIKFTEHGDVSVNITREKKGSGSVVLRIEVSDTGIGIDDEIQHTVFTEFEKAEAIPEGENTGVGLGLSITRQLVEMMGGKIGFRSNAQGGSTFWLTLPFKVMTEEARAHAKGKLNGLTVYMVGENASNRKTIAATMAGWGLICDTSGNFENAVSILSRSASSNRPYDILLVDISVSSSTQRAFDIVSQVRQQPEIRDIKVILLTAQGVAGDGMSAQDLGIGAYLTKPINRNDLKRTLLELNIESDERSPLVTRHSLREQQEQTPSVLIVERDRAYQKAMVGMISRLGVSADLAGSEKEAIEAIKSRQYSLLLVDGQLEGLDVLDFIEQLRHFENTSVKPKKNAEDRALQTGVVLISSLLKDKDRERFEQAGIDGFLEKPISIDKIAHLLARWDLIEGDFFSATEMVG